MNTCAAICFEKRIRLALASQTFARVHSRGKRRGLVAFALAQGIFLLHKRGKRVTHVSLCVQEMERKPVLIQVVSLDGKFQPRTISHYQTLLKIVLVEAKGKLLVTRQDTGQRVPGAYVKVYSQTKSSSKPEFFKDGYTSVLGEFDYLSLNTRQLENTAMLAVLVEHPELGSIVRVVEC